LGCVSILCDQFDPTIGMIVKACCFPLTPVE
jgi:hypothetical protein